MEKIMAISTGVKKKSHEKLDNANVLDSHNNKYHIYDNEFGSTIFNENQRKRR